MFCCATDFLFVELVTGRCCETATCRYIIYSVAKNQHFAPCGKNSALDQKMMIDTLLE